jgi:hydroxyacylglutathione hydrolase
MVEPITDPKDISAVRAWELVQSAGVVMVDVRGPTEYARAHPPNSLNVQYSNRGLAERLSGLLKMRTSPSSTSVIVTSDNEQQGNGATEQLELAGFKVVGLLSDAMTSWVDHELPIDSINNISVNDIIGGVIDDTSLILDVREPIEWEMGHVPGALLISLGNLREKIDDIPRNKRIVVICEAGIRSSSAASILQAEGFPDVANVPDGTAGYRNAGFPLEFFTSET